jgi:hypothetical protein
MKTFSVTLSTDAIVSATFTVQAENEEHAKELALAVGNDENSYQVDSLHETPEVFSVKLMRTVKTMES